MTKWNVLSQSLQQEAADTFLLSRASPEALQHAYESDRGIIIEVAGVIVASGFLWETDDPGLFEPGTLWVDPKYRGLGLSSVVFRLHLELPPVRKRLFIISHEKVVAHHALKYGFRECSKHDWDTVLPMRYSCGPCDRVSEEEKPHCPLRAVPAQCRLFVRD